MRRLILLGLIAILAGAGCQKRELTIGEMADLMNEISDLLANVKDAGSFEAAKPKLKPKLNRMRDNAELNNARNKAASGNKQPTKEDWDRAMKELEKVQKDPNWQRLMQAMGRYMQEVMRVSITVRGAGDWINAESSAGQK
jgi:hypothetical protein